MYNYYQVIITLIIFAKNRIMKVIADGDLKELLLTGHNRRYKAIANNKALFDGLKRAVNVMMAVGSVDELKAVSFLHYENKR